MHSCRHCHFIWKYQSQTMYLALMLCSFVFCFALVSRSTGLILSTSETIAWGFEQRIGVFVRFNLFQRQVLFTFKISLYIMHSGIAIPIELDSMYDTSANAHCIEFHDLQTIRLHIGCHECRDPIVGNECEHQNACYICCCNGCKR